MGLLSCAACAAKDAEIVRQSAMIERLTKLVEDGQRRVAELAEPGISLRLAGVSRFESRPQKPPTPPRQRVDTFPGYPPEYKAPDVVVDEG